MLCNAPAQGVPKQRLNRLPLLGGGRAMGGGREEA